MIINYAEFSHSLGQNPTLTAEQLEIVKALSNEQIAEIDNALLANCWERWRKVAAVVGLTMTNQFMDTSDGVPDIYYAERIRRLVDKGAKDALNGRVHDRRNMPVDTDRLQNAFRALLGRSRHHHKGSGGCTELSRDRPARH